jgi:hypothetical protein
MMPKAAQHIKETLAGRTPPLRALLCLALALSACGAPLAQFLRVVEVRNTKQGPASYTLVLSGDQIVTASKSDDAKSDPKKSAEDKNAPRLLKPLTDHWESAASIEIATDVPPPAQPLAFFRAIVEAAPQSTHILISSDPPDTHRSRGPPQNV